MYCLYYLNRLPHPKMSWKRAHESVRRRRQFGRRGHGHDGRGWSPRLNVSWTTIEEELEVG